MGRLNGKIAIITGAARGIGKATAILFAKEGAKVIATDVLEDQLKETVAGINEKYPDSALAIKHDISKEDEWKNVVNTAVEKYGTIHILVNNAAIGSRDMIYDDLCVDEWRRVMDIDATGTLMGILNVVPIMKKNEMSSIVNLISLSTHMAGEGMSGITYACAKAAIHQLTNQLAVRLGKYNIRLNGVTPGSILTPLSEMYATEEKRQNMGAQSVFNHMGEPNDIGYAVLYLASDESKYVTGEEIVVDGGTKIHSFMVTIQNPGRVHATFC